MVMYFPLIEMYQQLAGNYYLIASHMITETYTLDGISRKLGVTLWYTKL